MAGDEFIIQLSPMILSAQDKVDGETLANHSHQLARAMAEPDAERDQALIPSTTGKGIDGIVASPFYGRKDALKNMLLSGVSLSPGNTDAANA